MEPTEVQPEPPSRSDADRCESAIKPGDWSSHPAVNSATPCPYCGHEALHEQHCKRMCLACGWYESCVD